MKKLILLFSIVFLFTSLSNAQDYGKKGIWELGGSASFTSNSFVIDGHSDRIGDDPANNITGIEIPSATTILINFPVSYFIMDGLNIGLVPEFLSANVSQESVDITTSAYGIFFSAGYAFKTGGSVYPFINGMVGYSAANISLSADSSGFGSLLGGLAKTNNAEATNTTTSVLDETASGLGWGVTGGIKIQISKGALLTLGVGYHQRTYDPPETVTIFGQEVQTGTQDQNGNVQPLDRTGVNSIVISLGFSVFLGK